MKKIIAIAAFIATFASSQFTQAQAVTTPVQTSATGTNYQNSELLARAALNYTIDHYKVYFNAQNLVNNQWQSANLQLLLDQNLYTIGLTVNGAAIPLPQPLTGVPIPATGYQNVNVTVNALDKNGQQVATGTFNTSFLAQGSPIPVIMIPQFPQTAVQLPTGLAQGSFQIAIIGSNGYGWNYDAITGLLTINVFGNSTDVGYAVTDSDGGLISRGPLPFFQATPGAGTDTNSVLTLHNAGNWINMPLGTNSYNFAQGVPFDGWANRNGTYVPAKVVNVPDVNNTSKLNVYVSGPNVKIEVRQWTASGPMTLIPCTVSTDGYGDTTATTSQYVGKCSITVLPTTTTNPPTMYLLEVSRSY